MINLFKDGNGKYARAMDFSSTWSIAHFFRFLVFTQAIFSHNAKSILDVGFGDNVLVEFLEKFHYTGTYHGIDLNTLFVKTAQLTTTVSFPVLYETKEIFDINEKFDVIVLGEIIEHIKKEDAVEFLSKARDLLTKNGIIILSTPNKQNGEKVWPKDHEDEFSLDELQETCSEAELFIKARLGLWNNTENTKKMLSAHDSILYSQMISVIPKSVVNVIFNVLNPDKSRQVIIILKGK